jgi:hypothetical protein
VAEDAEPTETTRETERVDATQAHVADRAPSADEEAAAEKALEEFGTDRDEVAEKYEEMTDIGSHLEGEGKID